MFAHFDAKRSFYYIFFSFSITRAKWLKQFPIPDISQCVGAPIRIQCNILFVFVFLLSEIHAFPFPLLTSKYMPLNKNKCLL